MAIGRRTDFDFRLICPCQKHSRGNRVKRVAAAALGHLRRNSVALIVGVPLAFGTFGFPSEAMNVTLPALSYPVAETAISNNFPIFTTKKSREAFLHPSEEQRQLTLTLDVMKE